MKIIQKIINNILFCLFLGIIIWKCTSPSEPNDVSKDILKKPGKLSFIYLDGLSKDNNLNDIQLSHFDLGDLRASRDYYFILKNTGENPITDISLETDNEQFEISPQYIDTLKADTLESFLPIIRISAIHGIALNGVGTRDLMPKGINITNIDINGNTLNSNEEEIIVNTSAVLEVSALVMDIDLFYDQTILDLTHPPLTTGGPAWAYIGLLNGFIYPWNAILQIRNTSNIEITVKHYDFWDSSWPVRTFTLNPDESSEINLNTFPDNENFKSGVLELDGDNTITDIRRLRPWDNGKVYIYVEQYNN